MKKIKKVFLTLIFLTPLLLGLLGIVYLKGLPYLVSNPRVISFMQEKFKEQTNADFFVEKPVLQTQLTPEIGFGAEKIFISLNDMKLLEVTNFSTAISLREIFSKVIIVKKLVAREIFADINGLQSLFPQKKKKKETKNDWGVEIDDSLLGVQNCEILYRLNSDSKIKLTGKHIGVNNAEKIKRNVYFQLFAEVMRKDRNITLELNDNNSVYFQNKKFHIVDTPLKINHSEIFINLLADKKQNYEINLFSNNFNIQDILDFLNTQIFENDVKNNLVYFNDIRGNFDFKINITNNNFKGKVTLNEIKFKIKDVENIPVTLSRGEIGITADEITLNGFEGFYNDKKENKLDFEGTVRDYLKTVDIDIIANAIVRNDFFKNYLTKMSGTELELKGEAPTRIIVKSKNNIMDFVWFFMLKPEQNIKVANDFLPFEDSLRLMKSEMHLENNILDINSLDYHMINQERLNELRAQRKIDGETKDKTREEKKPVPIFTLNSSVDLAHNNYIKFIGFEIPEPLPSELLNAVLHQQMFKRGKISGKFFIDNTGKNPIAHGSMSMDKVLIPSQMTYIKEAVIKAKDEIIHLNALGGYRRAKFKIDGDIVNEIKYPVIVKDLKLSLEDIDAFKLLEIFNDQSIADDVITTDSEVISAENQDSEFDIRNLIIEQCSFHLDKGSYKTIEFSNLDADLTLNKDGIIDIKSNRFDFAEGESSLKANFDLINKIYNVKLGVLNVNSDIIADALLDLKKEITGKASGFLDLTTDDSMKLNGKIRFKISEGEIEKMGLVEYVLKCTSLFRNAISMINPATFADIVSVPEGKFDKIIGEVNLNNNVATRIKIKTYSSQLSNYIAGRYNIENGDTSLRIYSKFSGVKKGFSGFLRKISLNSLSTRLPMSSKNDENYYAVELAELPDIDADEKDCQIYLTKFEGDVVNNNYISSLKKIK